MANLGDVQDAQAAVANRVNENESELREIANIRTLFPDQRKAMLEILEALDQWKKTTEEVLREISKSHNSVV